MVVGQLDPDPGRQRHAADCEAGQHRGAGPAVRGCVGKPKQHGAEANRRQDEAAQVEFETRHVGRFPQEGKAQEQAEQPDGHVQGEDDPPVDVLDDVAAERGAKHRRQHERQTEEAHDRVASLRRNDLEQHRHTQRAHHPAAQALDHSEGDQAGIVPGQAAQQRAAGEQGHRDQVQTLRAEGVGQVAGGGHDHSQRQHVAGDHQLGLVYADAKDGGDLEQRDVHHGLVEHDHERADNGTDQHLPLVIEPVQQSAYAEARQPRRARNRWVSSGHYGATRILTSTLAPSRRGWLPRLTEIRTGTSWVTLVKLPEAFELGRIEKVLAVAGVIASTLPGMSVARASTWTVTGWPTWTRPMLVSSMLALTHSCDGSTTLTTAWPAFTLEPSATGSAITMPSIGDWTSTRVSPAPRKPILA